ncbi:MAG: hypothetical protein ABIA63_12715 [bacterium]
MRLLAVFILVFAVLYNGCGVFDNSNPIGNSYMEEKGLLKEKPFDSVNVVCTLTAITNEIDSITITDRPLMGLDNDFEANSYFYLSSPKPPEFYGVFNYDSVMIDSIKILISSLDSIQIDSMDGVNLLLTSLDSWQNSTGDSALPPAAVDPNNSIKVNKDSTDSICVRGGFTYELKRDTFIKYLDTISILDIKYWNDTLSNDLYNPALDSLDTIISYVEAAKKVFISVRRQDTVAFIEGLDSITGKDTVYHISWTPILNTFIDLADSGLYKKEAWIDTASIPDVNRPAPSNWDTIFTQPAKDSLVITVIDSLNPKITLHTSNTPHGWSIKISDIDVINRIFENLGILGPSQAVANFGLIIDTLSKIYRLNRTGIKMLLFFRNKNTSKTTIMDLSADKAGFRIKPAIDPSSRASSSGFTGNFYRTTSRWIISYGKILELFGNHHRDSVIPLDVTAVFRIENSLIENTPLFNDNMTTFAFSVFQPDSQRWIPINVDSVSSESGYNGKNMSVNLTTVFERHFLEPALGYGNNKDSTMAFRIEVGWNEDEFIKIFHLSNQVEFNTKYSLLQKLK